MNTDYIFLCGVMWAQSGSEDAGQELVRALHSDDPDVILLASALIKKIPAFPCFQSDCETTVGFTTRLAFA